MLSCTFSSRSVFLLRVNNIGQKMTMHLAIVGRGSSGQGCMQVFCAPWALQQPTEEMLGDLHSSKRPAASVELEEAATQLGSRTPMVWAGCLDRMLFMLSLSALAD